MPTVPSPRAALLALAAAAALVGCSAEAPTPRVTVYAEGDSVNTEASQYCFDDQDPTAQECREDEVTPPELEVTQGGKVLINVDRDIEERTWLVAFNGQQATNVQTESSTEITVGDLGQEGTGTLDVFAVEAADDDTLQPVGQWSFRLVRKG